MLVVLYEIIIFILVKLNNKFQKYIRFFVLLKSLKTYNLTQS